VQTDDRKSYLSLKTICGISVFDFFELLWSLQLMAKNLREIPCSQ